MTEPVEEAGPSSFVSSLGERGLRRAEPRASIAIAGAGCALGIVGVLVIAGDTGLDESGGDFNRVPGILLTALVVVGGYALLANLRRGPLATAGAVAAAAGVPPLLFFLTFDANDLPPYSTEGILLISTGAWLVSYVLGPGRGRPVFLGAGLIGAWLSLLQVTEHVFTAPFDQIEAFSDAPIDSFDPETGEIIEGGPLGSVTSQPDLVTIGLLSLGLGIAFVVIGRWLDRQGQHGAATPCTVAGLPCLAVGVGALAPDLEAAGTGLLLVVIGLALAHHGAAVGRRATSWIGAAAMAVGMGVFLIDMAPEDDATVGGMLLLAGGIAMVGAGHGLATARREPDEMLVTIGVGAGVGEPPAARHQVSASLPAPPPPPAPEPEASIWAPPPPPAPTPPPDPDPTVWAPPPPTDPPDPPAPT